MLLPAGDWREELKECDGLVSADRLEEWESALLSLTGSMTSEALPPTWACHRPNGARTSLLVIREAGFARFFVVGTNDVDTEGELAYWDSLIRKALAAIAESYAPVRWEAVLGPRLRFRSEHALGARVTGTCCIGRNRALTFTPTNDWYEDAKEEPHDTLGSGMWSHHHFTPLRVSEVVAGRRWRLDGTDTARSTLNLACAVLSLAWNEAWTVRLGPRASDAPLQIPNGKAHDWGYDADRAAHELAIPDWLAVAWPKLEARGLLRDAVEMFYEAFCAETEHCSLAMLGYISSVETLTQLRDDAPRCDECESVYDIGKRFDAVLKSAMLPTDGMSLDGLYGQAADVRHRSKRHGSESLQFVSSVPQTSFWKVSPSRDLQMSVRYLRVLTRRLLLREIEALVAHAPAGSR